MKLLFAAVAFLLTVITVQAEPILSQEAMVEKIIKSIQTEPQLWFNSGSYLIYAESTDDVKILKDEWYPYRQDLAKVAISFNFGSPDVDGTSVYVKVIKPFESYIKNKTGDRLLEQVKFFIFKELQKEVGHLIKKEPVVEVKPELKEEPLAEISEGDKL